MKNERVEKAQKIVQERVDYITSYHEERKFVEVSGRVGGDDVTYRVYDDGTVTER